MAAPITAIYASLLGILIIALALKVVQVRRKERVGLGDAEKPALQRAIRTHGNAIENIPMALILLFLLEIGHSPAWLLHLLGAMIILGRLLHASGLSRHGGTSFGRFYGALLSWITILAMAVINLARNL